VLARRPGARAKQVRTALALLGAPGLARRGHGHERLAVAAGCAGAWGLSGAAAVSVARASRTGGVWLTAAARAAAKGPRRELVRVRGRQAAPRWRLPLPSTFPTCAPGGACCATGRVANGGRALDELCSPTLVVRSGGGGWRLWAAGLGGQRASSIRIG